MSREEFTVVVGLPGGPRAELPWDGPPWLGLDGKPVDERKKAVTFRFFTTATPRERFRMDRLVHSYAGGTADFLDLRGALDVIEAEIRAAAAATLWPGGQRPEVDTDTERDEQDRALAAAVRDLPHPDKEQWGVLNDMVDRIVFMATWEALIIDPPHGWEKLGERELDDITVHAIYLAYLSAYRAATVGNAQSSKHSSAA